MTATDQCASARSLGARIPQPVGRGRVRSTDGSVRSAAAPGSSGDTTPHTCSCALDGQRALPRARSRAGGAGSSSRVASPGTLATRTRTGLCTAVPSASSATLERPGGPRMPAESTRVPRGGTPPGYPFFGTAGEVNFCMYGFGGFFVRTPQKNPRPVLKRDIRGIPRKLVAPHKAENRRFDVTDPSRSLFRRGSGHSGNRTDMVDSRFFREADLDGI